MITELSRFMAAAAGLLAVALLVSSCTSPVLDANTDYIPPPGHSLFETVADLPGGVDLREPSASSPADVDPLSYMESAGLVSSISDSVLLDSEAGGSSSWVMYGYDLAGSDPVGLGLELQFPGEPGGWLALADYDAGRWSWHFLADANADLPDLTEFSDTALKSAGDRLYFVILSHGGADLQLDGITVITDDGIPVTYDAHIAPLLDGSTGENSCTGCHGGISPPLETFEQVRDNAEAVLASVVAESDFMPPAKRWSQSSIDLFESWINGGKPEN